jgi:hypothetical protein
MGVSSAFRRGVILAAVATFGRKLAGMARVAAILLTFKALGNAAAPVIKFCDFKFVSQQDSFGDHSVCQRGALDLYNEGGEPFFLVRLSKPGGFLDF